MLSGILWGSAAGEVVWMFRYPGKAGYEFGIKDDATGAEVLEFRMDAKDSMSGEPVGRYVYDPRDDPDRDRLGNISEYHLGTDPANPDTDGDGHDDGTEVELGSDPLDPDSRPTYRVYVPLVLRE